MGSFVATDCQVIVNGVDLSAHVRLVDWIESHEIRDITGVGDAARRRRSGLRDGRMSVEWNMSYDPQGLYRVVHPLLGQTVQVVVSPRSGAASPVNPKHTVDMVISEFPVIRATYGELSTCRTTWRFDGLPVVQEAYWTATMTVGGTVGTGFGFSTAGSLTFGGLEPATVTVPMALAADTAQMYTQTIARIRWRPGSSDNFEIYWANFTQAARVEGWWLEAGPLYLHMDNHVSDLEYYRTTAPVSPGWSAGDTVPVGLWQTLPS